MYRFIHLAVNVVKLLWSMRSNPCLWNNIFFVKHKSCYEAAKVTVNIDQYWSRDGVIFQYRWVKICWWLYLQHVFTILGNLEFLLSKSWVLFKISVAALQVQCHDWVRWKWMCVCRYIVVSLQKMLYHRYVNSFIDYIYPFIL